MEVEVLMHIGVPATLLLLLVVLVEAVMEVQELLVMVDSVVLVL